MKRATFMKGIAMTLALSCISTFLLAQKSPAAVATGIVNGAHITIRYNSPFVKGRPVYGANLVPYGQVWRAGADSATRFLTDKEIKIGGKTLPAGNYTLYAIANENEWTIIISTQTGQWGINRDGSTTRNPAKDALTVTVKPKKSEKFNESLVYTFNNKGFVLSWENLDVPVSIK